VKVYRGTFSDVEGRMSLDCGSQWQPVQLHTGVWVYARRVDGSTMEGYTCREWQRSDTRTASAVPGWRVTVRFKEDAVPQDALCGFLTAQAAQRVAGPKVPGNFDPDAWVGSLLRDRGIQ
jgi:hypothetical protein